MTELTNENPEMTDVLVIGAGPVGLFTACELARHGVSVRLIEARSEVVQKSKAIMIHARTSEILENHGVIQRFLDEGCRLNRMGMYGGQELLAQNQLENLDSPYPFVLCLPQYRTEAILEQRLQELGGECERSMKVTEISQDADAVSVTLEKNGQTEYCQARWVVACDGAHSTIRKALDISYEGEDIDVQFTLADVHIDWDLADDEIHSFMSPEGVLGFIPLPGKNRWRMFATISEEARAAHPEPDLAFYQGILNQRLAKPPELSDAVWMSHFGIRQRMVENFQKGRVFLAGDAAHCHSPAGGQGMNMGLQDAFNLAWKLALVCRGVGRRELLDSYNLEREPIARALLQGTAQGTRLYTLRNPIARGLRNMMIRIFSRSKLIQQRLLSAVGQLHLNYRSSALVAEDRSALLPGHPSSGESPRRLSSKARRAFSVAPQPGDRALDVVFEGEQRLYSVLSGAPHTLLLFFGTETADEASHNLVEIASAIEAKYGKLIKVHLVIPGRDKPKGFEWAGSTLVDEHGHLHKRYGATAQALYLIRPDGYVGYRSQPASGEKLKAYSSKIFTV